MSNSHNNTHSNHNTTTKIGNPQNLNTHIEEVEPISYDEGYIHGRASEQSLANERQEVRDQKTASRGLLLGIVLTSLIGLTAGTLFFVNQNQQSDTSTPVIVPPRSASKSPTKETTIIERTTEIQPQPTVEQETQTSQPNVNITIPSSGQQSTSSQPNTSPSPLPTQSATQSLPTNSGVTQQNSIPKTAPVPSSIEQSTTTNPTSPSQPQNQSSAGTNPTVPPNTTTQTLPPPAPNQNQSSSSNSGQ